MVRQTKPNPYWVVFQDAIPKSFASIISDYGFSLSQPSGSLFELRSDVCLITISLDRQIVLGNLKPAQFEQVPKAQYYGSIGLAGLFNFLDPKVNFEYRYRDLSRYKYIMAEQKKLLVWILFGGPALAVIFLLFFAPLKFIEKFWFVLFALSMIAFIAFLKLSGGYKGISTVIVILTVAFSVGVTAWLIPKDLMSDGVFILLWWIVMPIAVWWDRKR